MAGEKILIIDNDQDVINLVSMYLMEEQYLVISAKYGEQALELLLKQKPDLIILEIVLPDIDGIEVCRRLRFYTDSPVIFLSCRNGDVDKIVALRVGGDDYITKPFSPAELVARIKANLRRSCICETFHKHYQVLKYPGLEIDLGRHEVRMKNLTIEVSATEFRLLTLLAENPNRVFHKDHLFNLIWDAEDLSDTRTVAVHISNLRKKIEPDPSQPKYILTVRGVGYKFNNVSSTHNIPEINSEP